MSLVKKTEDAKNVTAQLNPNFIKPICVLNVLQIRFRNSLNSFNQIKRPDNFILNFVSLLNKELLKVILVENDGSILLIFVHEAKIQKLSESTTILFVIFLNKFKMSRKMPVC